MYAWRNADEELECDHTDVQQERADRDELEDSGVVRQGVRGEQRQRREQDVARHHVGEESDGQREGPHQEELHELDRGDEEVQGLGHARREQVAGEVLEPLVLKPTTR